MTIQALKPAADADWRACHSQRSPDYVEVVELYQVPRARANAFKVVPEPCSRSLQPVGIGHEGWRSDRRR